MSDLIRPELRAWIIRWREALMGLAVLALGLWWAIWTRAVLGYVGIGFVLFGLWLFWTGLQRGRYRRVELAAGAIKVVEGKIVYFGPETGGAMDLEALARITLERSSKGPVWRLAAPGAPDLTIPAGALGSDALLDAFAQLPDFRTEPMLKELRTDRPGRVLIWERTPVERALLPGDPTP